MQTVALERHNLNQHENIVCLMLTPTVAHCRLSVNYKKKMTGITMELLSTEYVCFGYFLN